MNRDKIGTQTCCTRFMFYALHQCTKRYVDVHSMSVSQSSVHFYAIPILHFKFFISLFN